MIYTVTLNPAIDYVMNADSFTPGAVNGSLSEKIFFGGKGVNVSLILRELDIPSVALGFIAGFTGDAIEQGIRGGGIETDFVRISSGFSRINVKIRAGGETDINGSGPEIPAESVSELYSKLDRLKDGDTIVIAGSIPTSAPRDIYEQMLERLKDRKIRVIADARKDLLLSLLKYEPFLIKPNHHELGEIFGVNIETAEEAAVYAQKLHEKGARNVLVSMAERGSLLYDENGNTHICGACNGTLVNSVGAGDSMVAGFLAAVVRGDDYDRALKLGTAAGGATAFSEGLAKKEEIYRLLEQLK